MLTYLFYDLETSDLNPCFGQVLQFAAIRTHLDLTEIERHEIRIRLNPDVIPSPGALIINRISMEQLRQGDTAYDAIRKIHALFNTPGTISVGYNSLGFDDEFLRFSFYKNLLPPYTHQYAKNCARLDIYPMTVAYSLFRPNCLEWPTIDGNISYKLENINAKNQLASGKAHDAMVDVEVTLALAKRLHQDTEMWEYCKDFFEKEKDVERLTKYATEIKIGQKNHKIGLMIQHRSQGNVLIPVLLLGQSHAYRNQNIWLKLNGSILPTCTSHNISETTWVFRKKFGEPPFFIPLLERFIERLSKTQQTELEENKIWLMQNPEILDAICRYHQQYRYPEIENCDVNGALYQIGFPCDADAQLMTLFHAGDDAEKLRVANQFSNVAYRELAIRLLSRHFPQALTPNDKTQWQDYLTTVYTDDSKKALIDFREKRQQTIAEALTEIEQLKTERALDTEQLKILDGLKTYLTKLQSDTTQHSFFFSSRPPTTPISALGKRERPPSPLG